MNTFLLNLYMHIYFQTKLLLWTNDRSNLSFSARDTLEQNPSSAEGHIVYIL